MATVRAATLEDLPALVEFLAPRLKGEGGTDRYRRYFEYPWLADKPNLGFLIEDGGIRGFIGGIYSDRESRGRPWRSCNITSIWVDDSHRKLTLSMFKSFLAQPEYTFTSFSPTEAVTEIFAFFKFVRRETRKTVFTPAAGWNTWRRIKTRVIRGRDLERELDPAQLRVYRDHAAYPCGHFLIERGGERCYVVTGRRGHGVRAFADVIHTSNPALLIESIAHLHAPIGLTHRTALIGVDSSWVATPPLGAFTYDKLRPRMIRANGVDIDDVDLLYSEFVAITGWP